MEEKIKIKDSKTNKVFLDEICSKAPKKRYVTNKTNVYHIDGTWSFDKLYLKDYGPENNRNFRYVLVVFDNFSDFVWTVPLKKKSAQTVKAPLNILSQVQKEN